MREANNQLRGNSRKKLKELRQINNISTVSYTVCVTLVPKKGLALKYMIVTKASTTFWFCNSSLETGKKIEGKKKFF